MDGVSSKRLAQTRRAPTFGQRGSGLFFFLLFAYFCFAALEVPRHVHSAVESNAEPPIEGAEATIFVAEKKDLGVKHIFGRQVKTTAKKTSTVGAKTSTKVSTTPVKTSTKVTTSNTKTPTRTTSSTSRSASKSTSRLSSTTTRIPSSTSKTATPTVIPSTTSRSATRTPTQTPTTSSTSKVSIPTTTAAVTGQATTTKLTTAAAQPTVSVQGPVGGDWVAAHNARRRNVTLGGPVPDIAYSNYLATEAAKWATKLASECKFYHPDNTWSFQSGQNLYVVWGGSSASFSSAETTIKAWADSEFPYYNNATGACSGGTCGHFTQVMWENTQYVGCSVAQVPAGTCASCVGTSCLGSSWDYAWIAVCDYIRPGNCNGMRFKPASGSCSPSTVPDGVNSTTTVASVASNVGAQTATAQASRTTSTSRTTTSAKPTPTGSSSNSCNAAMTLAYSNKYCSGVAKFAVGTASAAACKAACCVSFAAPFYVDWDPTNGDCYCSTTCLAGTWAGENVYLVSDVTTTAAKTATAAPAGTTAPVGAATTTAATAASCPTYNPVLSNSTAYCGASAWVGTGDGTAATCLALCCSKGYKAPFYMDFDTVNSKSCYCGATCGTVWSSSGSRLYNVLDPNAPTSTSRSRTTTATTTLAAACLATNVAVKQHWPGTGWVCNNLDFVNLKVSPNGTAQGCVNVCCQRGLVAPYFYGFRTDGSNKCLCQASQTPDGETCGDGFLIPFIATDSYYAYPVSAPITTTTATRFTTKTQTKGPTTTTSAGGYYRPSPEDWVYAHNKYRTNPAYGGPVPEIKWSNWLADEAQTWANDLAGRAATVLSSDPNTKGGQLTCFGLGNPKGLPANIFMDQWITTIDSYDNSTGDCTGSNPNSCHKYKQVMWGASGWVGCALARVEVDITGGMPKGAFMAVCNYRAKACEYGRIWPLDFDCGGPKTPPDTSSMTTATPAVRPTSTRMQTPTVGATAQEWVDAHNARRANTTMTNDGTAVARRLEARVVPTIPPLSWSGQLQAQAFEWALKLASECAFYHPDESLGYNAGQNLFANMGSNPYTPNQVLSYWAESEYPFYNKTTGECVTGKQCGHFTQVMWSTTNYTGCAAARIPDTACNNCPNPNSCLGTNYNGGWITACNYRRPGNCMTYRYNPGDGRCGLGTVEY